MSICLECAQTTAMANDPRSPPLEVGICLCTQCFHDVTDELIDELQDERAEARQRYKIAFGREFVVDRHAPALVGQADE